MSCHGNNATPPSPAIAPGAELIDPAAVAASFGRHPIDPRIPALVPGFDAPFFQAGLAGYSDAAMRIIARHHGCPFCITEALLDRVLLAGGRGFDKADLGDLRDNIPGGDADHPLAGQLMGSEPQEMAAAALKMLEQGARGDRHYKALAWGRWNPASLPGSRAHAQHGAQPARPVPAEAPAAPVREQSSLSPHERTFEVIDINLACPVKKISSRARGGHWLREPDGAIAILRAVRDALPARIVTSVKLRRGSDDSPEAERNFFRIFDAAYDLGYSWTTVHGRTVEQKYVGPSRWTFLRDLVRRNPDRIIFGSGDVWSVHDIFRMLAYTGVRAVSVARGCIGNPWIFRQARLMMAGAEPQPPTLAEQHAVLRRHFDLCAALHGPDRAGVLMRKFAVRFAAHHPRPDEVKRRFLTASTPTDWLQAISDLYEPPTAGASTDSRTQIPSMHAIS